MKLKLRATALALAAFGLLWAVPSSADDEQASAEFTKSDLTQVVVRDVYPDLPKLRLDREHRFSRVRRPPRVLREVNIPVVKSQVDVDGNEFFVFTVTDTNTFTAKRQVKTVARGCHYPGADITFVLDKDKVFVSKHKDAKTIRQPCQKAEEITI